MRPPTCYQQLVQLLLVETGQQPVEDVVVPLPGRLMHDAGLLQQVLLYLCSLYHSRGGEVDIDVLTESAAVVVS